LCVVLALLGGVVVADTAMAASKYALVVGVNTYENLKLGETNPNLPKPEPDAHAVFEVLKDKLGFDVQLLTKEKTRRASIEAAWKTTLEKVRSRDVVLFYFAGHGIELRGRNYLLPRDASYSWDDADNADELIKSSIDLHSMIEELAKWQASTDALGIII